jgi:hypothetical protein
MHRKKYWILLPPFLVITIFLAIYLPQKLKPFTPLILLVFWVVYYTWIYVENEKNKKQRKINN